MLHPCKGFGFPSAVPSDSLARIHLSQDNRSSETSSALKKEEWFLPALLLVCGILGLIFIHRQWYLFWILLYFYSRNCLFLKGKFLAKIQKETVLS